MKKLIFLSIATLSVLLILMLSFANKQEEEKKEVFTPLETSFLKQRSNTVGDFKLPGCVVLQNSKFKTGKVIFLSGASIKSERCIPKKSDLYGKFTLIFPDQPAGNQVKVNASKSGHEVVNNKVLEQAAILDRKSDLKVVMCKEGELYENQLAYYEITKDAYLDAYNQRAAVLQKEGKEKAALIAVMEEEFKQTITSDAQAKVLLLEQFQASQERVKKLANRWLTINLDDQSKDYQKAYRKFLEKDIDGALQLLEAVDLEERLENNAKQIEAEKKRTKKRDQEMKQDISQSLFQARLYKLKYEFDKAGQMFELAMKYDEENPAILFEYAYHLQGQNEFDKSQFLYSKMLAKYKGLSANNSRNHVSYITTLLDDLDSLKAAKNNFDAVTLEHFLQLSVLADSISNLILIDKKHLVSKTLEDFDHEKDYWIYRARIAYEASDLKSFDEYLSKAASMSGTYQISSLEFEKLLQYKEQSRDLKGVDRIGKIALKEYPKNTTLLLLLGDFYLDEEKYNTAIKYYQQYLTIYNKNEVIHTRVGFSYEKAKNTPKAKFHYQSAIDLEGSGGQACARLRELTAEIITKVAYSECCDGTISPATGKGACSHHGGICKIIPESIIKKEYTMDCD